MRALIQRVTHAEVKVDGASIARIENGLLIFLGIGDKDEKKHAEILSNKISKLRIFNDEAGKMNLSIADVQGEVLVVSQFTLWADASRGNRPGYSEAARPEAAIPLYQYFMDLMESALNKQIQKGQFGADMKVSLENDGPVTIWLDTEIWN